MSPRELVSAVESCDLLWRMSLPCCCRQACVRTWPCYGTHLTHGPSQCCRYTECKAIDLATFTMDPCWQVRGAWVAWWVHRAAGCLRAHLPAAPLALLAGMHPIATCAPQPARRSWTNCQTAA